MNSHERDVFLKLMGLFVKELNIELAQIDPSNQASIIEIYEKYTEMLGYITSLDPVSFSAHHSIHNKDEKSV